MLAGAPPEIVKELGAKGWHVHNALEEVADAGAYRRYIYASSGEFGVAKETYVKSNSGWFSCRSACYLAAGRPVIAQDTGWSKILPSGEGVFAFDGMASISEALEALSGRYSFHQRKAREIAETYFESGQVLNDLLVYAAQKPPVIRKAIEKV